jgi:peptidoglycan/xylan/chitin deacetylase (PgdA/CDA1 family)
VTTALPLPTTGPWPWPPLFKASAAVHAGAAALALVPGGWPWAAGALVANHALLTAAGLWPRSDWLGPNVTRLPAAAAARGEVAITIDDGPDPAVTPAVLDQLDAAGARATFFCIAARAAAQPALLREIVRRGHAVQNHSHGHRHHFSLLGPAGFATRDRPCAAAAGRPERPGAALLSRPGRPAQPAARPGAAPAGPAPGQLDAARLRHAGDPARVLQRLASGLAGGDILLLHDGHARAAPSGRAVVLDVLPALLQRCRDAGLRPVTLNEALPPRGAAAPSLTP